MSVAVGALSPAVAQDRTVTLLSSDGTLRINGDLVSFSDGFYSVRTPLGEMRVSAGRVNCEGPGCPELQSVEVDFRIAGSEAMADGLMPLLVTGYAAWKGAEAQLTNGATDGEVVAELIGDGGFGDEIGSYMIAATGTNNAFNELLERSAEIGMATRRISRNEARALRDAGAGNMVDIGSERVIAVDSLVIITHPDNSVDELSVDELQRIFTGQLSNWSQVGGADAPIVVYNRARENTARVEFEDFIFGTSANGVPTNEVMLETNAEIANGVNADPNGIGYVGFAFQRGAKPLNLVKQCGITAAPNSFSAKTEDYPLNRRLYLYAREDNLSPAAEEFLEFAISDGADGVVAKAGFINLAVERLSQDQTGTRMRDLIQNTSDPFELGLMRELLVEMLQWDRLSTTFRFATGSSELDRKAELDLQRLIAYLKTQPEGTEVAVVGFTDSDGAFESNRTLSIGRAEGVAAAITGAVQAELPNVRFEVKGFGELSPAACNTDAAGKAINRRVEVWIRSNS